MSNITVEVTFTIKPDWRCRLGLWLVRLGARLAGLGFRVDE